MKTNFSLPQQPFLVVSFLLWTVVMQMNPATVLAKESNSSGLLANFTVAFSTATSSTQPYATLLATLDASDSLVPNGNPITDYHWQISTGEIFSGNRVTLKLTQSGSYTVDLSITDNQHHTASSRQIIKVKQTQKDSSCPKSDSSCIDVGYTFDITITDATGTPLGQQSIQVQQQRQCQPPDSCVDATFDSGNITGDMSFLNFVGLKPSYQAGDTVKLDLVESFYDPNRSQPVDVWATVETPEHAVYFLLDNPFQPFGINPQPFKTAIHNQPQYHLLEYTIPFGITGVYKFYAFYNQPGADLSDLTTTQRSNWAFAMTMLGGDY